MAAFEFGNYPDRPGRPGLGAMPAPNAAQTPAFGASEFATPTPAHGRPPTPPVPPTPDPPAVISEPILALKIYDSCRHKDCLGVDDLGFARTQEGDHVAAPEGAQSVHIENLRVRRIVIANKDASPLMAGYWDLEIRYVFTYDLRFSGEGNATLGTVHAQSSFTRRCSLFGSIGAQVAMATDLFGQMDIAMDGEPFVMVEAKAIGLGANIVWRDSHRGETLQEGPGRHRHGRVAVTIGLFSIIKLFRLVSLQVESRGFVIPPPCGDICTPDPCDVFEEQPFPMDSFAPLQRADFESGNSGNILNTAAALAAFDELEV